MLSHCICWNGCAKVFHILSMATLYLQNPSVCVVWSTVGLLFLRQELSSGWWQQWSIRGHVPQEVARIQKHIYARITQTEWEATCTYRCGVWFPSLFTKWLHAESSFRKRYKMLLSRPGCLVQLLGLCHWSLPFMSLVTFFSHLQGTALFFVSLLLQWKTSHNDFILLAAKKDAHTEASSRRLRFKLRFNSILFYLQWIPWISKCNFSLFTLL